MEVEYGAEAIPEQKWDESLIFMIATAVIKVGCGLWSKFLVRESLEKIVFMPVRNRNSPCQGRMCAEE